MSENQLIPVATKEKIEKALEFFYSLKEVKFTTDQEYENGVELCKSVKSHIKEIDKDRISLVKPYNEKVSSINGECNGVINKLKNAENVLKNGMSKYFQEKERKRIEEQKRLEAEAEKRRKQEEEKARREAAKEEQYREEGRDEMADNAKARAETSQSVAENITAPIVTNSAKMSGTSYRKTYKVTVVDKRAAALAMINNDILITYVYIDEKGLQRLASAQKGNLSINGIRITEDFNVSLRG